MKYLVIVKETFFEETIPNWCELSNNEKATIKSDYFLEANKILNSDKIATCFIDEHYNEIIKIEEDDKVIICDNFNTTPQL